MWPPVTVKKWIGGKAFTSNEGIIEQTNGYYFEELPESLFFDGLTNVEERLEKCTELKWDSVEK